MIHLFVIGSHVVYFNTPKTRQNILVLSYDYKSTHQYVGNHSLRRPMVPMLGSNRANSSSPYNTQ